MPRSAGSSRSFTGALAGLNKDHGTNFPTDPSKLTMEQRVAAYKMYADDVLRHRIEGQPGPGPRLDAFKDPKAAAQFFDIAFQHNLSSRSDIVQKGINATIQDIPKEVREAHGIRPVEIDPKGGIGRDTRDMMFRIIGAGYGDALRSGIAGRRYEFWGGNPEGNNRRRIDATR